MPGQSQVVYIAGSGRSGSSLLDVLLGNHSEISATGEVHRVMLDPLTRLCGCGVPIARCPYWVTVRHTFAERMGVSEAEVWQHFPVTVVRGWRTIRLPTALELGLLLGSGTMMQHLARLSPLVRAHVEMASNSWGLYDAIASLDSTRYVVDSTKNGVRMKLLYLYRPERTKIIYLVRDGRAVAASLRRRLGVSVMHGAWRWRTANRNVKMMMWSIPVDRRLVVRYEDLCDAPQMVLASVCRFLGLRYTPDMSDLRYDNVHSIPGSPMLFEKRRTIVKDTRWKGELSSADLRMVDLVAGRLNRSFGYQ